MLKMLLLVYLVSGFAIISLIKLEKKRQAKIAKVKKSVRTYFSYGKYMKMYKFLSNNAFTRSNIANIYDRLSTLSVFSPQEQVVATINFYLLSNIMFLFIMILTTILYKELHIFILMFIFANVIKNLLIYQQMEAIRRKLLNDFHLTISSIRLQYTISGSVEESISECESAPMLRGILSKIVDILNSGEEADILLEMFYKQIPFNPIQTLAGVCYITKKKGDTPLPNGQSNYISALDMIDNETMTEIERMLRIKSLFGSMEFLPLSVIILMKLVEVGFGGAAPGLMLIYNGVYGYYAKIILLVISLFAYSKIIKMKSTDVTREDDRSIFIDALLMRFPRFYNICKNLVTTNYAKLTEKSKLLKDALSRQDLIHVNGKKLVLSMSVFMLTLLLTIYGVTANKQATINNVSNTTITEQEKLTTQQVQERIKIDKKYLAFKKKPTKMFTEKFVNKYMPKLDELNVQVNVKRLMTKYDKYHAIKYHWWYVILAYIAGLIAWRVPEFFLKSRAKIIQKEAQAEVLQIQTILAILMYTNVDTLDALFWLEKQSIIFKPILLEAYQMYPSDPELSIAIMKEKSSLVEFRILCDKLAATIQRSTLSDAFSNLRTERQHILAKRKEEIWKTIERRRAFARMLALGPVYLAVFAYVVTPMLLMGVTDMIGSMSNL